MSSLLHLHISWAPSAQAGSFNKEPALGKKLCRWQMWPWSLPSMRLALWHFFICRHQSSSVKRAFFVLLVLLFASHYASCSTSTKTVWRLFSWSAWWNIPSWWWIRSFWIEEKNRRGRIGELCSFIPLLHWPLLQSEIKENRCSELLDSSILKVAMVRNLG